MSTALSVAKPDAQTTHKVEAFVTDWNREVGAAMKTHDDSVFLAKENQTLRMHDICSLTSTIATLLWHYVQPESQLEILIFAGVLCISEIIGHLLYRPRYDGKPNQIADADLQNVMCQLSEKYGISCAWKSLRSNVEGTLVMREEGSYTGSTIQKPQELIDAIRCNGFLFLGVRHWIPTGTNGQYIAWAEDHQVCQVEIRDDGIPLAILPLDADATQRASLHEAHCQGKFLPISGDTEAMEKIWQRFSKSEGSKSV